MKPIGETRALEKLHDLKTDFAQRMLSAYEHRAKSCLTCETPGACCLDAHFVNVHITTLEAKAIRQVIEEFPEETQRAINDRTDATIAEYGLSSDGDTFSRTYACPLFEKGTGCLVHEKGKPLPCIAHACYEKEEDLPPDELLTEQEGLVENLNRLVYRGQASWVPLPIAIGRTIDR